MSLSGGGGGENQHGEQQRQQQGQPQGRRDSSSSVLGTATGQAPSAAAELAVTTRRTMRGARREQGTAGEAEAYPWLNAGAVGRPRPVAQRQWQKPNARPLGDADAKSGTPPERRRGRTTEPGSAGSRRADLSARTAIPRSTSFDMVLSHSTLVSGSSTAAAATSSQAPKRNRSWRRRPMGRSSSTSGAGGGRRARGTDSDEDEERGIISFRDAALVAWLNSVLNFEQDGQHAHGKTLRWVCHEN